MAKKYPKRHLMSFVVRKMQIKVSVSCHFKRMRRTIIQRVENNECW